MKNSFLFKLYGWCLACKQHESLILHRRKFKWYICKKETVLEKIRKTYFFNLKRNLGG